MGLNKPDCQYTVENTIVQLLEANRPQVGKQERQPKESGYPIAPASSPFRDTKKNFQDVCMRGTLQTHMPSACFVSNP